MEFEVPNRSNCGTKQGTQRDHRWVTCKICFYVNGVDMVFIENSNAPLN